MLMPYAIPRTFERDVITPSIVLLPHGNRLPVLSAAENRQCGSDEKCSVIALGLRHRVVANSSQDRLQLPNTAFEQARGIRCTKCASRTLQLDNQTGRLIRFPHLVSIRMIVAFGSGGGHRAGTLGSQEMTSGFSPAPGLDPIYA